MRNKSFFLVRLNMDEVVSQWLTGSGNKLLGPGDQKSSLMNISCIASRANTLRTTAGRKPNLHPVGG